MAKNTISAIRLEKVNLELINQSLFLFADKPNPLGF